MQLINGLIGRGRGRDDLSALITVIEEVAGVSEPEPPDG
jgi:hypothetical protein